MKTRILLTQIYLSVESATFITTDRRSYHLALTSTPGTAMAALSWTYPQDALIAIRRQQAETQAAAPVAAGLAVDSLNFGYAITGDTPPWRPLRAFDDGQKVYIQFPAGIGQGDLPPLFLVGPDGSPRLVNYQYRAPYYVVDRLFGAVELRLGGQDDAKIVRISRNDVKAVRGAR